MKFIPEDVAYAQFRAQEWTRFFKDTANSLKDAKLTEKGEMANRGVLTPQDGYRKVEALVSQARLQASTSKPSQGGLFTQNKIQGSQAAKDQQVKKPGGPTNK